MLRTIESPSPKPLFLLLEPEAALSLSRSTSSEGTAGPLLSTVSSALAVMFAHGDIHHTGRKPFHGFQRVFNEIHRNEFELERIGQTLDVLTRRDRHGSMPAAVVVSSRKALRARLDQTHGFPHGLIGFCVSPYAVHNRVGASRLRLQFPGNGLNLFRGQAAGLNETLKPEDIERDSGERL